MSPHLRIRALASVLVGIAAAMAPAAQARVRPDDAVRALLAGNRRFQAGELLPQPLSEGTRRTLSQGQAPYAIVVTTTDSRVVPEHVFNVGLGELYVVRIAGGVCDPATLASVEYAAEHLGVSLCIVLGHDDSRELAEVRREAGETPGLARIAARMRPGLHRAESEGLEGPELLARAAEESTHETIAECLRRSAVLRELARLEHLRLLPAMYSHMTGAVTLLTPRPSRELLAQARHREGPPRPKQAGLPPHVALSLLQAGHRRFLAGTNGNTDLSADRRHALAAAQRPFAIVLCDADSRLAPEHVFDTGLGDIAVVRVAGCTLDDEVLGSVEHLVREYGPGLLVVLAPDRCGVTEHVLRHTDSPKLSPSMRTVAEWLEPSILDARHAGLTGDALLRGTVQRTVQRAVREARLRSPMLRALEQRGQLGVLGALYRLADGEIEWLRDAPAARTGDEVAAEPHPMPALETPPVPAHGREALGTEHEPSAHASGSHASADDHAAQDGGEHGATAAAPGRAGHGDPDAHEERVDHTASGMHDIGPRTRAGATYGDRDEHHGDEHDAVATEHAAPDGAGHAGSTLTTALLVAITGVLAAYGFMQLGSARARRAAAAR